MKLDKLWFPTWVVDPVKLNETEYPLKLDEAVNPVKLDELWFPGTGGYSVTLTVLSTS